MIQQKFLTRDEFGRVSGVLECYKPFGITSHDLVDFCRRVFHTSDVGHIGTLDPLACGKTYLLVGKSTKLASSLQEKSKKYYFEMVLNLQSNSLDLDGKLKLSNNNIEIGKDAIIEKFDSFPDQYDQTVPIFSSVKVNGQKLYAMARNADDFHIEIEDVGNELNEIAVLHKNGKQQRVALPKRTVEIVEKKLLNINTFSELPSIEQYQSDREIFDSSILKQLTTEELQEYQAQKEWSKSAADKCLSNILKLANEQVSDKFNLQKLSVELTATSGFYVRKFAQDMARHIDKNLDATVVYLERIEVIF